MWLPSWSRTSSGPEPAERTAGSAIFRAVQREAPLADRGRATQHAQRVGRGLRKPANWVQLVKFSAVGASGYVVNLAVYTTLVKAFGTHYILAAVLAFCVAVTNNFLWNRHWTFRATEGHMGFQAARFFTVSVLALGLNLIVLQLLVSGADVDKVVAQAIAILAATPLNFIGNKLWSFGQPESPRAP
jgi:dolichol-phosphate mannosyltransferase